MNRAPAFQLYADDFLGGTADMSAEEVGAYIRLLCHQWNKGGLPNDPDRLAKMAGLMAVPMASPSLGYVLAKFQPCADGQLRNERLEKVRAESESYRKNQSENGKKGTKTRWENSKPNGGANGGAIATPMANGCPNDGSPSPSPKTINRKAFVRPTIEEIKAHCLEIGLPEIEAEKFEAHHEARGWRYRQGPMKSWKGALKTWKHTWDSGAFSFQGAKSPQPAKGGGQATWKKIQDLENEIKQLEGQLVQHFDRERYPHKVERLNAAKVELEKLKALP